MSLVIYGAIHKVRTLRRGEGGQAKSVQVHTRGEGGNSKSVSTLEKKENVF